MAKTVNTAFGEFMKNTVNLEADVVSKARESRDNLLSNIAEFSGKDEFFTLWDEINVQFGSFARKTKCRELDDIDLMIGVSARGATYNSSDPWDDVKVMASTSDAAQSACARADGTLNSTKVTNKFKTALEAVREYSRSDIRRNGEAVVLNLKSKEWSFDIVPCFHTVVEDDGRAYYLIPNGKGNWKKTDPLKDKEHVTSTNQAKDGRLLELVRLVKRWNKTKNFGLIPSYLLETMVVYYADSVTELNQYIDFRFKYALKYIADHIECAVSDMKDIQEDINSLSSADRYIVKIRTQKSYEKACEAWEYERDDDQENAIVKWGEVLGNEFPKYG